jgi:hypothetical protein
VLKHCLQLLGGVKNRDTHIAWNPALHPQRFAVNGPVVSVHFSDAVLELLAALVIMHPGVSRTEFIIRNEHRTLAHILPSWRRVGIMVTTREFDTDSLSTNVTSFSHKVTNVGLIMFEA